MSLNAGFPQKKNSDSVLCLPASYTPNHVLALPIRHREILSDVNKHIKLFMTIINPTFNNLCVLSWRK